MFLSAVRSTSKPARCASSSKSPLESRSHPRSLAFVTVWPGRNLAMPAEVTWSKRTSMLGGLCDGGGDRVKAARGKFKYCVDLFPGDVELLDDFLYGGSCLEVFEHGGHGHPGIAKHPCAAQSPRHAFDRRALGPIESCHVLTHLPLLTSTTLRRRRHARSGQSPGADDGHLGKVEDCD